MEGDGDACGDGGGMVMHMVMHVVSDHIFPQDTMVKLSKIGVRSPHMWRQPSVSPKRPHTITSLTSHH